MSENIEQQVIRVVAEHTNVDPSQISRDSDFIADLSFDSLEQVELVMDLEDTFGVSVSDEEAADIKTVGNAIDFIAARGAEVS